MTTRTHKPIYGVVSTPVKSAADLDRHMTEMGAENTLKKFISWAEDVLQKAGLPIIDGKLVKDVETNTLEWRAAKTLSYAVSAQEHIAANNVQGAVYCAMRAAENHLVAFVNDRLARPYQAGAASLRGSKEGGEKRINHAKRQKLEADLTDAKRDRPGESDAFYAKMIRQRRIKTGHETDSIGALKMQISRLKKS